MRTKLLKKCFAAIGLLATLGMTAAQMPQMPVQAATASETKINIAISSADIKSGGKAELTAKIELGSGVMSLQGVYAYVTLNRALTDGETMDVKQPSGDMAFTYGFKDNNKKQYEVMGLEQYGTNVADGSKKETLFNITLSGLKAPVSMYFDFIGEHSYLKTGSKSITETMIVKQGDLTSSTGYINVDGKKAEDANPDTTGNGENYGKEDAGELGAVTEDTTKKDTTDKDTTTSTDTTNKDTTNSTDTTNKDTTNSTDTTKKDSTTSTDTTKKDTTSSTESGKDSAAASTTKDTTGSADSSKDAVSGTSTDGVSMNANAVASSADTTGKGNSVSTGKGDSTPQTRDTSNMIFGIVGLAAVVALIIIIVAVKAKTKSGSNR